MSPPGPQPPEGAADPSEAVRRGLTRRQFVGTAVAVGAAIVWTSEFPFADAVIGQSVGPNQGPTGPTGPTGSGTGATGPTVAVPSFTG
jgi:hypothetical protein